MLLRNAFISKITELAKINKDIFLLSGDLGFSVLEPFAESFPDRYLNVGIAEQNMTLVATGLAREGYNVFTYSIGNFPTLRCMEQIRHDICYHQANVKVVAVGAGFAYGPQGVSHQTTEDISMMRAIPNMLVCSPGDRIEASLAADFFSSYDGPGYIRLNKTGEIDVHARTDQVSLLPGEFIQVLNGKRVVVLAIGAITGKIKDEIRMLNNGWSLYSSPFVGVYNKAQLLNFIENYEQIITVEEHQLNGGFGASILEVYSDMFFEEEIMKMPKIKRIGIKNKFLGYAGDQDFLRQASGLTIL